MCPIFQESFKEFLEPDPDPVLSPLFITAAFDWTHNHNSPFVRLKKPIFPKAIVK